MGEAALETRPGFLEGREGDGGCTQGILGLMPSHWCVELGPEPSGGQGCAERHVQRQLWAQEDLRQLCPHPISCLTQWALVLLPRGYRVGPGCGANEYAASGSVW